MRECPGCAVEVEPQMGRCPICGYDFPRRRPTFMIAGILVLAALLLPILIRIVRMISD